MFEEQIVTKVFGFAKYNIEIVKLYKINVHMMLQKTRFQDGKTGNVTQTHADKERNRESR